MEGVRNIFCTGICVEADKISHLCEPVYHYHYLGLTRDSASCVGKFVEMEPQGAEGFPKC